jgi:AraC-like DNA-binding protein
MHETLRGVERDRLERSCDRRESIRFGPGVPGLQRAEVRLTAVGFEPHRHDTYAIGITTAGVQVFRYRGKRHVCLPGQVHILHPDELHDGGAGTHDGFAYRIVYVEPGVIRDALGARPLPFVAEPVHDRSPVAAELGRFLAEIDDPISDLARHDLAAMLAGALVALSGGSDRAEGPFDHVAVERVREYLAAYAHEQTPASTLEQIAGIDRYELARQFRRAYGTSPDRYRTMRRLTIAAQAIRNGVSLASAAAEAGFADQSHMTRQFKRTYGLTPGRWANALAQGANPASLVSRTATAAGARR